MRLQYGFTSADVRSRFEYLMDNMPEEYEQEIWDEAVVAWYLCCEAVEAKSVGNAKRSVPPGEEQP